MGEVLIGNLQPDLNLSGKKPRIAKIFFHYLMVVALKNSFVDGDAPPSLLKSLLVN